MTASIGLGSSFCDSPPSYDADSVSPSLWRIGREKNYSVRSAPRQAGPGGYCRGIAGKLVLALPGIDLHLDASDRGARFNSDVDPIGYGPVEAVLGLHLVSLRKLGFTRKASAGAGQEPGKECPALVSILIAIPERGQNKTDPDLVVTEPCDEPGVGTGRCPGSIERVAKLSDETPEALTVWLLSDGLLPSCAAKGAASLPEKSVEPLAQSIVCQIFCHTVPRTHLPKAELPHLPPNPSNYLIFLPDA